MEELIKYVDTQIKVLEDSLHWAKDYPTLKYYDGSLSSYKNIKRKIQEINGTRCN